MQSFLHRLSGSTLRSTVVCAVNSLRQRFIIVFVLLNNDIFETFATRVCVEYKHRYSFSVDKLISTLRIIIKSTRKIPSPFNARATKTCNLF